MLGSKDEAHFLFSNAAKIRSMARQGPAAIRDELLTLARTLEARATELDARDLAAGNDDENEAKKTYDGLARDGRDQAEDDRT